MKLRVALLLCALSRVTVAQPSDSIAAAEQLFTEARTLMDAGDFAAACPKFEASRKLDPTLGTLLNLATCYEKANQIASAWGRFRELEALATRAGDEQRATIAREQIAALEPRLPKLAILPPTAAVPGLVVTRDGAPLEPGMLGSAIYIDPGEHTIHASAPGYRAYSTKVSVTERETQDVQLPALEKLPEVKVAPTAVTTVVVDSDPGKARRIAGIAVMAGGAASLVTGIGFGLWARSTYNSAFEEGLCFEDTKACYGTGQVRTDQARDRALVANIVSGAGLALAATGAFLYFTAPRATEVAVTPTAGGAAVTLGGRW